MAGLEAYIKELLIKQDCVVIPDFGAFVSNPHTSLYHSGRDTFSPPYRNILFNRLLVVNDGLLAGYMVQKSGNTYSEAMQQIAAFVSNCKNDLQDGKRLEWDGLGFLFLDEEKNIRFVQDNRQNYLLSSFGLEPLRLLRITGANQPTTPEPVKIVRTETEDRKESKIELPSEEAVPSVTRRRNNWRYALLVPVVAGLFWLPYKAGWLNTNTHGNYASVNPFTTSAKESVNTANLSELVIEPAKEEKAPDITDSNGTFELNLSVGAAKPLIVTSGAVAAAADTTRVATPSIKRILTGNFAIITGCFANEENANRLVEELKQKGYAAERVGTVNGLHRVAIGKYASRADAQAQLSGLKGAYPGAWISSL